MQTVQYVFHLGNTLIRGNSFLFRIHDTVDIEMISCHHGLITALSKILSVRYLVQMFPIVLFTNIQILYNLQFKVIPACHLNYSGETSFKHKLKF